MLGRRDPGEHASLPRHALPFASPGPYAYLPFGAGPRMCIGAAFASQVLRIVLPMILQYHRFTLPSSGVTLKLRTQGITMVPAPAIPITLLPRNDPRPAPVPVDGRLRSLVELPGIGR